MEAVLTICGRYARKIIISAGNYPLLSNSSTQANTRYSKMFGAYNASTLNAETIRQFVQWHHRIDSSVGYAFVHMSPDLVCQNRLRCPVATAITQGALRPEQKASSKHISPLSYCHPLVQSGLASNVLTCPILPLWILWLAKQTTAGSTKTGWNYTYIHTAGPTPGQRCARVPLDSHVCNPPASIIYLGRAAPASPAQSSLWAARTERMLLCLSRILAILSYKLLYIRTARILYYRYDIYIYMHILHVIICYIYILNCIYTNIQILDSMYIYAQYMQLLYYIYIHAIVIYII